MAKKFPHIKVFITRKFKLRAKIQVNEQSHPYEVTIGGKNWEKGLGLVYSEEIHKRCEGILMRLRNQIENNF